MQGPSIFARSVTALRIADDFNNQWQYHPQSDRHSKIACWAIMFDLLQHCTLLRRHVEDGKLGFGINHTMGDFRTQRKKRLDLVICTPSTAGRLRPKRGKVTKQPVATFMDLAAECEVKLTQKERALLRTLPSLKVVPVGSVCIALEAKAAMTEHVKALPRLHDELDSSHNTVHGHSNHSIAAALVVINFGSTFTSPLRNKHDLSAHTRVITRHNQPQATLRAVDKVTEIRRRSVPNEQGFDAIGIVVIDFKNDGSPVKVVTGGPSPDPTSDFHYDKLIERLCAQYRTSFQGL